MRRLSMLIAVVVLGGLMVPLPASAGGGCHGGGQLTAGRGSKGMTVPIEKCMFTPTVLFVEPGDEVTWVNRDPVGHTVTGAGDSWGDHSDIPEKARVSHVFKTEGVFPYYCLFHPSMVGAVVVGDPSAGKAAAAPISADIDRVLEEAATEDVAASTIPASAVAEDGGLTWLKALALVVLSLLVGWALATGVIGRTREPSVER